MANDAGRPGNAPGNGDGRAARLAAALRDNLRRRKAQARGEPAAPVVEADQPPMTDPAA